jgi:acetyl-CoA carboxylase biotin carboxyl carrier protein
MNQKEIKELIEFLVEQDIAEFELERGEVKLRIRRTPQASAAEPVVLPSPAAAAAALSAALSATAAGAPSAAPSAPSAPAVPPAQAAEEAGLHVVKSPIVGTFFEAPSPGAPPFVKIGDHVDAGQPLCIVEAMKLMNEIESDFAGEIVKKLATNGQPVEYGQPLFAIRSS